VILASQDHLQLEHVVAGDAVFEAMHPTGVPQPLAAMLPDHLAGRDRGRNKSLRRSPAGSPSLLTNPGCTVMADSPDSRSSHRAHAAGHHQQASCSTTAPPRPVPLPARHERHSQLMEQAEWRPLARCFRQHTSGAHREGKAVAVIGEQLLALRPRRAAALARIVADVAQFAFRERHKVLGVSTRKAGSAIWDFNEQAPAQRNVPLFA